ncbi:phosphatidylinositol N-acetylglucosaminyltransferase-domain-containing protein [Podospora aff. communis PSN243]|uniref:Phosphatidylinositol N-acetylglucosaminyltransferase-domain-containing protein n=1 Tax=Podospora aff. communis PSN243 TaxID=3040156 RepID=A0AAV9GZJ3_9PEZI|nr:phosphatidylinositol N-acetylglucosaminyltransferase-domain-containing protein [Podospora aff. communis PSN243]
MAPPSGLQQSAISSDTSNSLENGVQPQQHHPVLVRSATVPLNLKSSRPDPSHLAPEDAFVSASPPRRPGLFDAGNGSGNEMRPRRMRRKEASRSRSRRRKRFQKLLWVKQSYPDNYTDQATFLENLQRNPRVQPYDFWPLVADSTIILQHVCSVIIFIVCFVGIFQERVSPVSVAGWGSSATFVGWLLWDWWVGQESQDGTVDGTPRAGAMGAYREFRPPRRQDSDAGLQALSPGGVQTANPSALPSATSSSTNLIQEPQAQRHAHSASNNTNGTSLLTPGHVHSRSVSSVHSVSSQTSAAAGAGAGEAYRGPGYRSAPASRWDRAKLRLGTIKSAILIYFTLLGMSPILKSLTRSTSSDSIWAMSFWLLTINIFFFDYKGSWDGAHKFPVASLSTNAALMASTVLASRLPSTGQVFSLTLFSIEVFGLFPVFRVYARQRSWRYHVLLTVLLVLGAGCGVGMVLGGEDGHLPWKNGLIGMVVACLVSALALGGCSWWLIGLQKYKNEIYGPWDPARPIIISRRHWDDE